MATKKKGGPAKISGKSSGKLPGKLKVAVCGASGYTGAELLRILHKHPKVEVTAVTSERSAGRSPADLYPQLHAYSGLTYEPLDRKKLVKKADLFFLALPHAASQEAVSFFHSKGKKVVDLSADFRLKDPAVYEKWYKTPHTALKSLGTAVYGLPELYRKEIKKATLVANPGCYPTASILGIAPALKAGAVETMGIVVDAKSGTSGAGRKADQALSYCEVNEGFKAYGVGVHRHTPEIEQELSAIADTPLRVDFTPHLLPVDRGILSTMYLRIAPGHGNTDISELYARAYEGEPFVKVLPPGEFPNIKDVRGTNRCLIGFKVNERTGTLIVVSVIDNLVKGASGQAVQNMNLMMGFRETTSLEDLALCP
ncbi:MAG: N-acetyl-gamma-glutamyl-phosphate reductase [Thermodesulfovibrionales bacterium]|nr:N-acetyl-gamma-glutamyl-phosphate reductase [Thermodesulfovibrionales bacterium]